MAIFCTIYYVLSYIETIPQIVKFNDGRVVIVGGNLSAELFNGEKNAFEESQRLTRMQMA